MPSYSNKKRFSFESKEPARRCDHEGCGEEGEFRAPKTRELREYYWFCLEHVRAYNKEWDFYAGLSSQQIEGMRREDTIWQRPTWKLGMNSAAASRSKARFRVNDPFGFFDEKNAAPSPKIPEAEREAMTVLGMEMPLTLPDLRARYRHLVKEFHPDANRDNPQAEEHFKRISHAYSVLKKFLEEK